MDTDLFSKTSPGLTSPPARAFAITPNDGVDLAVATRGLMVASAGDVALVTVGGDTVTLPGLLAGVQYAIRANRVLATGTTATGLIGLA
ncbi:MAG: hypothetical protein MI723_08405 [Caulobacterales bacterium]|nr:hypothetical protein [Caulobacterales bacterium]